MVMCGILVAEFLILGGGWHTRLSWPYGDLVPGNYLAKAGLPAFVIMAALAMSRIKWLAMSSVVLVVFNLFVSLKYNLNDISVIKKNNTTIDTRYIENFIFINLTQTYLYSLFVILNFVYFYQVYSSLLSKNLDHFP